MSWRCTGRTLYYFILSNEIMENISAIKVVSIYSEMRWYHFTVDWYHHSMREIPFSIILGLVVFRKDFACIVLVDYGRIHVISSSWRHTLTSLKSSRNANLHAMSVRRQLQAAFLNRKILLIPSFKWHFKPFSRCKLCFTQYYTQ